MKKTLSTILMIAMLISIVTIISPSASAQSDAWDGITVADSFNSGSGTEADPYIIMNGEELYKLSVDIGTATNPYGGTYFKLGNDINLGGMPWIPIGSASTPFIGNFDGNGKTVFNFVVLSDLAGLFGNASGASIKSLKIDYADIQSTAGTKAAALVATCDNTAVENVEVGENVSVSITLDAANPTIGGVLGFFGTASTAKNIINRANVSINYCEKNGVVGGVCGLIGANAILDGAINYGNLLYANTENATTDICQLGGVIGSIGASKTPGTVKNVINYGSVDSTRHAGGIIGRTNAADGHVFENCFNAGSVKAGTNVDNKPLAGLILGNGEFSASFTNCISITIEGLNYVGAAKEGKTYGDDSSFATVLTIDELSFNADYTAVLNSVTQAMPAWTTVTDTDYEAPEGTEPEGTEPEGTEPEDTKPEDTKPEDTKPEETKPEATEPTQTPSTDAPGTEKPAEGGCGSVVAGGLAILAVVALAGFTIKKRS